MLTIIVADKKVVMPFFGTWTVGLGTRVGIFEVQG